MGECFGLIQSPSLGSAYILPHEADVNILWTCPPELLWSVCGGSSQLVCVSICVLCWCFLQPADRSRRRAHRVHRRGLSERSPFPWWRVETCCRTLHRRGTGYNFPHMHARLTFTEDCVDDYMSMFVFSGLGLCWADTFTQVLQTFQRWPAMLSIGISQLLWQCNVLLT